MPGIILNTDIIQRLSGRLSYLGARNDLLAQNIAHMETPNYQAKDLLFQGFVEGFQSEEAKQMDQINIEPKMEETKIDTDAKANGNNVIMEDQMARLADNSVEFMVATEVIKKNLALLKFAAADQ
ncbi:MAG: hypothetical protein HQM16_02410 [Deltaproteobacteria bacterium]|nr:hypothetical protein [Deltaproteobacteria bacterium]